MSLNVNQSAIIDRIIIERLSNLFFDILSGLRYQFCCWKYHDLIWTIFLYTEYGPFYECVNYNLIILFILKLSHRTHEVNYALDYKASSVKIELKTCKFSHSFPFSGRIFPHVFFAFTWKYLRISHEFFQQYFSGEWIIVLPSLTREIDGFRPK